MEHRSKWGGEKAHIPFDLGETLAIYQRCTILSKRFALPEKREISVHLLMGVGEMLASAGDDGNVILWIPSETPPTILGEDHAEDKETWRVKHMCRSSTGAEIYDLAWSPDGVFFITGGVDNTARIFNAQTGMRVNFPI